MSPTLEQLRTYVSVNEAAAAVGVTRRTIYHWLAAGRLRVIRTAGGALRIDPTSLVRGAEDEAR